MDRGAENQQLIFNLRQLQLQAHCPQPDVKLIPQNQESTSLLLLTGSAEHWEVVRTSLMQLPPRTLFLSHGAQQLQEKSPLPVQHPILDQETEQWLNFEAILSQFSILEVGLLTRTTLVKVALGMADSMASALILRYLREERVVRAWYPRLYDTAVTLTPRQRVRANQNREYLRIWKQLGVEFQPLATLLPTKSVTGSAGACEPHAPKMLWTIDDVKEIPQGQVLRLARKALITPLAQDELRVRQIEVVREVESHVNW